MALASNQTRVFHRHLKTAYPTAESSAGAWIVDGQGERYLDASGGAAVSCLGHGHPKVIQAIKDQLDRMAFAHTAFFTSEPAETLADLLVSKAPEGFGRVYFLSGGSEANEAALKLARQIQLERGRGSRDHFVSRLMSYHGNTIGALSVGGNLARRKPFAPILMPNVSHIPPCYAYRHRRDGETETDYGLRAAGELEKEILRVGPDKVIAFIAETVVGATLGVVPPAPGYFREIRRICDEHGVLMILDEVMCGMGRTGTLFACEQDGVSPDMIAIAKGLGGGYQPIGALMVREDLVAELEAGTGFFQHGHTYIGHATACAAGLAVQQVIEEENLLEQVRDRGTLIRSLLAERLGEHPNVGDIRGRGLFIGVELVKDRDTKAPFETPVSGKVKAAAMANRLICYPGSGSVDGDLGDHVLLAPPYIMSEEQAGEIVERLARSIEAAIGG
jgi:adenosylmethionine-8-amino-7-oxononanoate aminotransferase